MILLCLFLATPGDFTRAVEQVRPAVVEVEVARLERAGPGIVQSRSIGSGFIFDRDGHVLTCNHVIAGFEEIVVRTADGVEYSGDKLKVTGRDPFTDLAVLQVVSDRPLPAAMLADSDSLAVGQPVAAVGNPYGLPGSATSGIVSALSRWGLPKSSGPDFQAYIQTDALINPGNSGGPLVDARGRVVGICTFGKTAGKGNLTGIGFATPANLAREIAAQLVKNGVVLRGYLGTSTQELTGPIAEALGLAGAAGALVSSVAPGGPAARAGFRPGDVVLELDSERVPDVRWFQNKLAARPPEARVGFKVYRQGAEVELTAVLGAWPVAGTEARQAPPVKSWLGIEVKDAAGRTGAEIVAIEPGGQAAGTELKPGDVIVEVGLQPVTDAGSFAGSAARLAETMRPVLMRVMRGREVFYLAVEQ